MPCQPLPDPHPYSLKDDGQHVIYVCFTISEHNIFFHNSCAGLCPVSACYQLRLTSKKALYIQAELKQGKEEAQRLKAALLESEAAVLRKERQLVDLKKQMKEERRRAEPPLQMDQAVQAEPIQHADLKVQVCAPLLS